VAGGAYRPMLAKLADRFPDGEGWRFEPKWDGFRALCRHSAGVEIRSRDDKPFTRYFPELENLLAERGGPSYAVDGEIVVVRPEGFGFDELLQRIHPAASRVRMLAERWPASLVVFDLLELDGRDLTGEPLALRRHALEELAVTIGAPVAPDDLAAIPVGPDVWLTPQTNDREGAMRWFEDDAGIGQDGVVAKRGDQAYLPGERGWMKVKHRKTVDVVVGGFRTQGEDAIGSLLLGLYDEEGTFRYLGHTSSFKVKEKREIRELLRPLEEGAPTFEGERQPGGQSRWSRGKTAEWNAVRPELVCEVSYDRMQGMRFRHGTTFVRWRPDRRPETCTFEQVAPPRR